MTARRWIATTLLGAATVSAFVACSLVQSLDYLQADLDKDAGGVTEAGGNDGGVDAEAGNASVVVAANQSAPDYLAQDATSLYWLAGIDLVTVPKTGGEVRKIATVPDASFVVVDPGTSGNVYLAVKRDVLSVPKSGGTPVSIFKGTAPDLTNDALAVDDNSLFLFEYDEVDVGGFVYRMQKDGGSREVLSADGGNPLALVADNKSVLWYDDVPSSFFDLPRGAAAGTATALPLGGGIDTIAVTGHQLALDNDTLFFVDSDDNANTLMRSRPRAAAGSLSTIFRGTDEEFGQIALAGSFVYAVEGRTGVLVRIPKTGGNPEILVKGIQKPTSLVIDDAFIYFAESAIGATGSIRKVPLPK